MSQRQRLILGLLRQGFSQPVHGQTSQLTAALVAQLSTSSLISASEASNFWGGRAAPGQEPVQQAGGGSTGVKSDLIQLLGSLPQATNSEDLWGLAQDNPKVRSKRFMKKMLQQLRSSGVARTERLDGKHFGYRLAGEAAKEWQRRNELPTPALQEEIAPESPPPPKSSWFS